MTSKMFYVELLNKVDAVPKVLMSPNPLKIGAIAKY